MALLPGIIKKLGESKIAIRQASQKVLKEFVKLIKPRILFANIKEALEHQNWILRKEILELICVILLTTNK